MLLRHGYCLFVLYPHPSELSMSVENNIIDASRKRKNVYLQNITHKTKDRVTGTSLEGKNKCSRRVSSFSSTCGTRRVTFVS
jgi:hypothetical protein